MVHSLWAYRGMWGWAHWRILVGYPTNLIRKVVCAFVYAFKSGTLTIVPGWGGVPGFILCTKPMRTSLKKTVQTMGERWEVPDWRCLNVCVRLYSHTVRGHFSIWTIGPRESVLCSQLSSDVVRVQSL